MAPARLRRRAGRLRRYLARQRRPLGAGQDTVDGHGGAGGKPDLDASGGCQDAARRRLDLLPSSRRARHHLQPPGVADRRGWHAPDQGCDPGTRPLADHRRRHRGQGADDVVGRGLADHTGTVPLGGGAADRRHPGAASAGLSTAGHVDARRDRPRHRLGVVPAVDQCRGTRLHDVTPGRDRQLRQHRPPAHQGGRRRWLRGTDPRRSGGHRSYRHHQCRPALPRPLQARHPLVVLGGADRRLLRVSAVRAADRLPSGRRRAD